jgi:hypothetical protein
MVAIEEYRTHVQQLLEEYRGPQSTAHQNHDEVEAQLIVDTDHDHYQLIVTTKPCRLWVRKVDQGMR